MYRKEFPKYVLFTDTLQNSIRDVTAIELEWLRECAGHYYEFGAEFGEADAQVENYDQSQIAHFN